MCYFVQALLKQLLGVRYGGGKWAKRAYSFSGFLSQTHFRFIQRIVSLNVQGNTHRMIKKQLIANDGTPPSLNR